MELLLPSSLKAQITVHSTTPLSLLSLCTTTLGTGLLHNNLFQQEHL